MRDYFIRRFLLIPPTLIGVTLIVFALTWVVPGGPVERYIAEIQLAGAETRGDAAAGRALSEEQIEQMKAYYGFDKPFLQAYVSWVFNVLRGDFGRSFIYNEPVLCVIASKLPISIYFGLMTFFFTYVICIPLGVVKAIKHRTWIDNWSSILVFAGYAIPSYVFGSILILIFAAQLQWFPLGGFVGENFADLSLIGKVFNLIHHTTLPLMCYLIGSFAFLTLLMKNNLLDNLAADYMRTAVAKGVKFDTAVVRHAFRNSIIPIATTFGQNLLFFLTGSFLIEVIFDIDGFGLLGFRAIVDRDYFTVMGILVISSFVIMLGNIISDMLVALVDPRIRFN
ncbi:MAG: ABC transporter permease subunit [Puniceicoccaceae bacterium]|nr:MAG: ABC transporter permease subunit [Puniceicoccaceae bacterium]